MSDTDRDREEDSQVHSMGGVEWDGVPAGTSGSAAPGTEAAPDEEGGRRPTGEGAEDARAQYADQAERYRRDRQEAGGRTIGEPGPNVAAGAPGGPTIDSGPSAPGRTREDTGAADSQGDAREGESGD